MNHTHSFYKVRMLAYECLLLLKTEIWNLGSVLTFDTRASLS
jgi:hypothetical protein